MILDTGGDSTGPPLPNQDFPGRVWLAHSRNLSCIPCAIPPGVVAVLELERQETGGAISP